LNFIGGRALLSLFTAYGSSYDDLLRWRGARTRSRAGPWC